MLKVAAIQKRTPGVNPDVLVRHYDQILSREALPLLKQSSTDFDLSLI